MTILSQLYRSPDVLHSPLYAIVTTLLEAVGRSGTFRSLARVAVPACRADASVAICVCVVWSCAAALGAAGDFESRRLQIRRLRIRGAEPKDAEPTGAEFEERHPLRRAFFVSYFCGVLWYVGNCYWIRDTMMHYGDMPPLAPELLTLGFSLVLGLYFGIFGLGVVLVRRATGSVRMALGVRALSLGRAGPCCGAHHQRSMGPAWLLADRQRARQSARAVDRRLRHHICSCRGERAACRRVAGSDSASARLESEPKLDRGALEEARARLEELVRGSLGLGCLRRSSARLWLCGHFCFASEAGSDCNRGSDSAESRCGRGQQLAGAGVGPPYRRIRAPGRRAVQDLHRRNSADRRARGRNHLPAVSHASRSCRVAGIARAVFRG